tara:strand:- start:70335 stop:70868 length:534 start_codon:yes stop_codon:yes gene_type:complete
MRFEIGNIVRVIDEDLQGEVIQVSKDEVTILADDFEFTYTPSDLVVIKEQQRELSKFSDINHPLLKEKMKPDTKKPSLFKTEKREVILEVDLHIEQLMPSHRNMDTFDILNYQLRVAKQKLEWGLNKRIQKIVFIHGVGDGILKKELLLLFKRYPVKHHEASFKKYGYGATAVVLTP